MNFFLFCPLSLLFLLLGHLITYCTFQKTYVCIDEIVPKEKVNKSLGQLNSILTAYLLLKLMDQYAILPPIKAELRSLEVFGSSNYPKGLSDLLCGKTSAAWNIRGGKGIFLVLFPSASWWESRSFVDAVVPEMRIAAGSER